jgi:serine/threonine-protein kinase
MHPGDSHESGIPHRAAGVVLCTVLALLFWAGADRLIGIERGYYDLFQRLTAKPARAPVLIIDTGKADTSPWLMPRFDEVLLQAKAAGAALILPASPPPLMIAAQDIARLQALIALEKRSGSPQSPGQPGLLDRQLQDAEQLLNQQHKNVVAVAAASNVILGLGTTDPVPGREQIEGICEERIAAASSRYGEAGSGTRLAALVSGNQALCKAAFAIGHLQTIVDGDGVLRRTSTALPTRSGMLPSASMAALTAGDSTSRLPRTDRRWIRFYSGQEASGFRVISAEQLLAGGNLSILKDQIAVVGTTTGGLAAPVHTQLGPAALLATEIANLADSQYINRPEWAPWAEALIALLLGAAAGFSGRLSLSRAAVTAAAGAALLLVTEFTLLLSGTWLQFASLALFCLTGMAILQGLAHLPGRQTGLAGIQADDAPASSAGPGEELDLAFSVLRQQPTTDRTKEKLYDLAMEHGRKRDYARAERVFRHLAARDPGYRDVAAKLEKLSGARGAPVTKKSPAPATAQSVPEAAPIATSSGIRSLGRYELERVIGRGAMATVYLGRDPTINRRVAIKTLPLAEEFEENDLATARANFKREAESAGRLSHPHIISIYDAGEDNQVAYLAMEYIEGRSLSHYAQVGRLLQPKVVFELMARAAEALHYAHTQNVVHRDVKPANILYNPATDTMKITDFGIARLTDSSRTRTGIILGTPSYMSPEQLSASQVTGQSDLYSLGVTMYHLLVGAPPFQADSIPRLMDKIVKQRHRPIADIRDDVPPCTDSILDQVLAKDPADRFPSGRALAYALRECASHLAADHI